MTLPIGGFGQLRTPAWISISLFFVLTLSPHAAGAAPHETELQRLERILLASPAIHAEPGFTARVIVPPGQLYDPDWMRLHGKLIWLSDDGGEIGERGGRILGIDTHGRVSAVVDLGTILPPIGFDQAPSDFGAYAGDIFTLAQARVGLAGATTNHIIQRLPWRGELIPSVFCTLPNNGTLNHGVSGFGSDARFGPAHSPFAGKFFAVTMMNATIHQVTAEAACTAFATFDPQRVGTPVGLQFTPDAAAMLVSVNKVDAAGVIIANAGAIVRVRPDGSVAGDPLATGFTAPTGMAFAPQGFGRYGGELFVADAGDFSIPVPMTQPVAQDGKLYRITPDGQPHLVASGFFNPAGVQFVGDALWVADLNGDFIGGRRELPDGFIVEVRVR